MITGALLSGFRQVSNLPGGVERYSEALYSINLDEVSNLPGGVERITVSIAYVMQMKVSNLPGGVESASWHLPPLKDFYKFLIFLVELKASISLISAL
ncbi:hypothetical protein SAMN05444391_0624 [Thermocrinis minervae]|uniref:Uncharacterized protein n=1 Tax=Thermocrinis minervae TaxID=381751 RepID=A0A1M6RF98_9AQUI|nr:hypothetical protein SAMN05444391_0624 [Thermocrinis minervae]